MLRATLIAARRCSGPVKFCVRSRNSEPQTTGLMTAERLRSPAELVKVRHEIASTNSGAFSTGGLGSRRRCSICAGRSRLRNRYSNEEISSVVLHADYCRVSFCLSLERRVKVPTLVSGNPCAGPVDVFAPRVVVDRTEAGNSASIEYPFQLPSADIPWLSGRFLLIDPRTSGPVLRTGHRVPISRSAPQLRICFDERRAAHR